MHKYQFSYIRSIITICLILFCSSITLAQTQDIEQLDKQEIEEGQNDITKRPEDVVAWLNNNIMYYFPSGPKERWQQFVKDFYKSGATIISNVNNAPKKIKDNADKFIKDASDSKATQKILTLFGLSSPSPKTTDGNITKLSGTDFAKTIIAPRVNKSMNSTNTYIKQTEISLKLEALYLSNEALTQ